MKKLFTRRKNSSNDKEDNNKNNDNSEKDSDAIMVDVNELNLYKDRSFYLFALRSTYSSGFAFSTYDNNNDCKEENNNLSYSFKNDVKKIVSGSGHILVEFTNYSLLNSDEKDDEILINVNHSIYGSQTRDYGQYGDIISTEKNDIQKENAFFKVNLNQKRNDLQNYLSSNDFEIISNLKDKNWIVDDFYCKFNFTYFKIKHVTTNLELLLSSGWNNASCLSHDEKCCKTKSYCKLIRPVIFNHERKAPSCFLDENEKIVCFTVGGCHTVVVTRKKKEQFIYTCGGSFSTDKRLFKNISLQDDLQYFYKDYKEKPFIVKLEGGYNSTFILMSNGDLFSLHKSNLSVGEKLQQVNHKFENEKVKSMIDYEDFTGILTVNNNVYVFHKQTKGSDTSFSIKCNLNISNDNIYQLHSSVAYPGLFIITRNNEIYFITATTPNGKLNVNEVEVTVDDYNMKNNMENKLKIYKVDFKKLLFDKAVDKGLDNEILKYLFKNDNEFQIGIYGGHETSICFIRRNEEKRKAILYFYSKLHEQLIEKSNFSDVKFN
ncbi:hypothetical protein ABK040_000377 [Willaertia magna]